MQFGIVCDRLADVDLVTEAEAMGYDFCWAFDTPMLRSNPFVLLALAAGSTSRIQLGVGVAVTGLREAPEAANAIAKPEELRQACAGRRQLKPMRDEDDVPLQELAVTLKRIAGANARTAARSISSVPTSDCMAMSVVNNRSTMSWGSPLLLSIRPSAKTTSLARMRSRFSR